jgi:phage tail sheath protein FI
MALVSPGVQVSVTDESAYGAAGNGTVPLIVVATRENKTDPTGSESDGIAKFTKATQAGNVISVTSQRELTQYFGNPTFTTSGTAIVQGSETSEYGLLAAYSYLGQGSRAFIVRANIDLAELDSTTIQPTSTFSTANTYWLDTDASKYGIHVWNSTTEVWDYKTPTVEVISTAAGTVPAATVVTGGYHVVISTLSNSIEYYKESGAAWVTAGATLAPHYSVPVGPSNGDVWVKTTSPGNGVSIAISKFIEDAFTPQTVVGVSDGSDNADITTFVPQDASSATALTSSATAGGILLGEAVDQIDILVVSVAGAPSALASSILAQIAAPTATASTGQYWFNDTINSLDIYVSVGSAWTAAADVQYSTTAPTTDGTGNALADGDVWVDTTLATAANARDYPKIYQHNGAAWVKHSNTDQTSANGVLFADIDDTAGGGAAITGAPDAVVYPDGMLVVNMAQSKNTVRSWNGTAWRNAASNNSDGSGAFGRFAQRKVVAAGMQAVVAGADLREEQYAYSLLAAPNYPELTDELVTLNSDRGETAFIIIDTPMRKNATEAISWVKNSNVATENGEDGLVTNNTYSAAYYPAGSSTEPVTGKTVVVPASHMALYTFAYNDNISFPWFAPAGLTRGVVQNASSVGFITSENEFKAISLTQGQRDEMYQNKLNPITTFIGQGTVIFGQKTLASTTTALDRVNVARLVAYLRERFDEIARPFLFEQNDTQTRARAAQVFERFLADILSRRGVTDFAVVCDTSNNTPARIDRNELYIDVAIEPTKSVEFIYIPIRIVNSGTLSNV